MTDDKVKVVQAYEYDSYGNQHDSKNSIKQPYTYTGREHDRETGLYYYRARYYDPEVGRFISEDPIGFAGGDVNLYGYVHSSPIIWIDPYGLKITQVWRPLASGQFIFAWHTAINVNGTIYGFTMDGGVIKEDPRDYNWGSHEVELYGGDEYDQEMLEALKNAAAGIDNKFTEENYEPVAHNCYHFVECMIRQVLNNPEPKEDEPCPQ